MIELEFCCNFKKLHNQNEAALLHSFVVKGSMIPSEAIEYDAEGKFEFDKDENYICAVLIGNRGIPFTTYRKSNLDNLAKFQSKKQQKRFKIVIVGDEK